MKRFMGALARAWEGIVGSVLPLRSRTRETRARTLADIPASIQREERLGCSITTLAEYQTPAVQQLIHALKYDGDTHAARLAAALLADFLSEEIASTHVFSPRTTILAPIPLHPKRRRERGFNQVSLILDALPSEFKDGTVSAVQHDLLSRTRATPHQTHLTREDRLSNVAGAFVLGAHARDISRSHVILVDDVTTTGATLANAANPLRHAGARVSCIAIARA